MSYHKRSLEQAMCSTKLAAKPRRAATPKPIPAKHAAAQHPVTVILNKSRVGPMAKGPNALWDARKFDRIYQADPMVQIEVIKSGAPATYVIDMANEMGLTRERLFSYLGIARATVDRKVREKKPLSPDDSSKVVGMANLIGQVQTMVEESGDPEGFSAPEWVARWIESPVPALGNRKPAEFMDTPQGQALISRLLAQMQSGAYA